MLTASRVLHLKSNGLVSLTMEHVDLTFPLAERNVTVLHGSKDVTKMALDINNRHKELAKTHDNDVARRRLEEEMMERTKDVLGAGKFYDLVLNIVNFSDVLKDGWPLLVNDPTIEHAQGPIMCVVGEFNKGKSWFVTKVTKAHLPCSSFVGNSRRPLVTAVIVLSFRGCFAEALSSS